MSAGTALFHPSRGPRNTVNIAIFIVIVIIIVIINLGQTDLAKR